jgi:thiol:disulfide interchange protein
MTSLDEAYGDESAVSRPRQSFAGGALVGLGVLAIVAAMAAVWAGNGTAAKQAAGIAAGVGIPLMLIGIVVALPASRRTRVGVIIGTVLSAGGVWLFQYAYPDRWTRTANPLAFETLLIYGVGCAIAVWFVFTAIANTRLRNNPQGTVSLEVVMQGETKTVEVSNREYRKIVSDGGDPTYYIDDLED